MMMMMMIEGSHNKNSNIHNQIIIFFFRFERKQNEQQLLYVNQTGPVQCKNKIQIEKYLLEKLQTQKLVAF
jgi:hypothetical protein